MSDIHTENSDGQNIKPDFTAKNAFKYKKRYWDIVAFFFFFYFNEKMEERWGGYCLFFSSRLPYLPSVSPLPRIVPGKSKQIGSQIFF